jgi:hypothetical protein
MRIRVFIIDVIGWYENLIFQKRLNDLILTTCRLKLLSPNYNTAVAATADFW